MHETVYKSASVTVKDEGPGSVVAKFSTFDIVDRSGDIVRPSAFTDGQSVPMVWSHDWTKPIGKGVIRVTATHAEFHGSFFRTSAGQEARETVREMGDLQEWSWGFRITGTQRNDNIEGLDIVKAEPFEVSPVLVGANPQTSTLAVKSEREAANRRALNDLERGRLALEAIDLGMTSEETLNALEHERLDLEAIDLR